VISSTKSTWRPVTTGAPQESILAQILLDTFNNNLDDGTECRRSKFAVDGKLGGVVDSPANQRDLNKLKKELTGISRKSAKGNAKSCTWGGITSCTGIG